VTGTPAGSGISYGRPHTTRHVERAVSAAIDSAGLERVMGVFLFLTDDHLAALEPALRAAARAARCTQVIGCSAMGVLTDQDWTVDCAGAAALAFGDGVAAGLAGEAAADKPLVSLATPRGLSEEWLARAPRLGAIASDSAGRGPLRVWSHGRVTAAGTVACALEGADTRTWLARGIQPLTAPLEVAEARGVTLIRLGKYPALKVLLGALPPALRGMERIPLHRLLCGVTFGEPESALDEGRYRLDHIVAADPGDHTVTLTDELRPGQRLFWALRDCAAAEEQMRQVLQRALRAPSPPPDFGLLFSCLGRGPGFYGGEDRDIVLLREACPGMPFAGFYGNGEIAPRGEGAGSGLYQYSAALGLCRRLPV